MKEIKFMAHPIGTQVFAIYEDSATNDFYCNETQWRLFHKNRFAPGVDTKLEPIIIQDIQYTLESDSLLYKLDDIWFDSIYIHTSLNEAQKYIALLNNNKMHHYQYRRIMKGKE